MQDDTFTPEPNIYRFEMLEYWRVGGLVIGAKDEDQAWREYWRVCDRSQIRKKEADISKMEL